MKSAKTNSKFFNILLFIFYTISLSVFIYFLLNGWEYYFTSFSERVRHTDYKLLKPGGIQSHGLGILGSVMLLSLLFYSIRKRFQVMQSFGNLSHWLHIHIFFGINGPLFVILHSTFKLNGLISLSFWAMIIVAISGIVGRYLYTKIPRNIQGQELSLKEVEQQHMILAADLQKRFEGYKKNPDQIMAVFSGQSDQKISLTKLIWMDIMKPISKNSIRKRLISQYYIPKAEAILLLNLANQKIALERRIVLWNKIHNLFHYWHVFHKPFAIVMYIIMAVHISISVWLGYTWIF